MLRPRRITFLSKREQRKFKNIWFVRCRIMLYNFATVWYTLSKWDVDEDTEWALNLKTQRDIWFHFYLRCRIKRRSIHAFFQLSSTQISALSQINSVSEKSSASAFVRFNVWHLRLECLDVPRQPPARLACGRGYAEVLLAGCWYNNMEQV